MKISDLYFQYAWKVKECNRQEFNDLVIEKCLVLAAYLMKTRNISVEEAIALIVKSRRVRPNAGFLDQLHIWQKNLQQPSENPPSYAKEQE